MAQEIIATLKAHAEANYRNGYDWIVECWGKAEWNEFLSEYNIDSVEAGVAKLESITGNYAEVYGDISATVF